MKIHHGLLFEINFFYLLFVYILFVPLFIFDYLIYFDMSCLGQLFICSLNFYTTLSIEIGLC